MLKTTMQIVQLNMMHTETAMSVNEHIKPPITNKTFLGACFIKNDENTVVINVPQTYEIDIKTVVSSGK